MKREHKNDVMDTSEFFKEESIRGNDQDQPLIEEEPNSKVREKKIKDSTPTVLNCKVNNNNIHKYYNAI